MDMLEFEGDTGQKSGTTGKKGKDIKAIDKSTVHRICSGQVIVTLSTAVKELVENSIDAGATSIDIRMSEYGSKSIEVIDNGVGITEANFDGLGLKHHTSKLSDFDDLTSVTTFGFRGEALSSLCAMSKLTVTTKTAGSKQGFKIEYDHRGIIASKAPCARQRGTTVILGDLFATLPVRHKEFHKNLKREHHKMIGILYAYCLLHPSIRISCNNQVGQSNNKILSLPPHTNLKERIASIFGAKQVCSLVEIKESERIDTMTLTEYNLTDPSSDLELSGFISKPYCGRSSADRQFIFINSRPCEATKIARIVNEVYHSYGRSQYPFLCLHIKTKQENVDVNLTPDKRRLLIQNERILFATLKCSLLSLFSSFSSSFEPGPGCSQPSQPLPSSSQESTQSSFRHTPAPPKPSPVLEQFWPQLSTPPRSTASTAKKGHSEADPSLTESIRSKFQQFQKSAPARPLGTSASNAQPYKRPRKIPSHNSRSKQPRLTEFLKSHGSEGSKRSGADSGSGEDADEEDGGIGSGSGEEESGTSLVTSESEEQKGSDVEDKEGTDSCFFSQSQESTVMYDDESDGEGTSELHQPISVTVSVDWNEVKRKTKLKKDGLQAQAEVRKFRAKMTDNENAEEELRRQLTKDMFYHMKVIGQFNLGFIVVRHGSDLFIVDQHAADEKYNFETLQKSTVLQSQRLISPISLELTAVAENILMDNLPVFQKNGFEFQINEDADGRTGRVKLATVPYSKNYYFGKTDVDELIFMLEDAPEKSFCRPSKVRSMFASRACRKSVMIGMSLSHSNMTDIVTHLGELDHPWNCPHGRPTLRHLFNLNLLPSAPQILFNHG